jgi:two-component system, cell cycle sensor histidine kinase and response regulator CckA
MDPLPPGTTPDHVGVDLYLAMLDSALDAIVGMDSGGLITEFNVAAQRMFGYSRAEAIGQAMSDLIVPPALREQHAKGLARYIAGGESTILGRRIAITAMRRDRTEFPVELSIQRVGRTAPPIFTGFIRDITERKELEEQLRHSQKMDAIGQLAGGVAHDFNNLLTVILGHASRLTADGMQADDAKDSVRQMAEAAERAASLTRQLLAFSRKQVIQPTELDLNEVVSTLIKMLERILGEDITLQVDPSLTAPLLRGDRVMMEQIVLNLALNARDAMPGGGGLMIAIAVEEIGGAFVRENPEAIPGRFVRLSVTDTGCGIAPEQMPRIFEPFFTTKDIDKGTGLGLATVYGIVKQHRGWLTVRSELGKGTTFHAYLPAIDIPPQPAAVRSPTESARGGLETILLVEDESAVRALARQVLERHGYTVLEAVDGVSALAMWQEQRERINLVVTDMVMPGGVSGRQLADRILADGLGTRIIITSGYSVDMFGQELAHTEVGRFLPKPYNSPQLLRAVRAILDGGTVTV